MSDKKIAARLQVAIELCDQLCLRRTIEVDHHVAAEDEIQGLFDRKGLVHQVDPAIAHHLDQVGFDLDHAGPFPLPSQKMPLDDVFRKIPHAFVFVDT